MRTRIKTTKRKICLVNDSDLLFFEKPEQRQHIKQRTVKNKKSLGELMKELTN